MEVEVYERGSPMPKHEYEHLDRFCGSFLRKGEVLAYVGRNQNLKDLKGPVQVNFH